MAPSDLHLCLNSPLEMLSNEEGVKDMDSCLTPDGKGHFHSISSGCHPPYTVQHSFDFLAKIAEMAAPNAEIKIVQVVSEENGQNKVKL